MSEVEPDVERRALVALVVAFMALVASGLLWISVDHGDDEAGAPPADAVEMAPGPTADPSVYVLSEDLGNLPQHLRYDAVIHTRQIPSTFLPSEQPRLSALVVSRQLLDALVVPPRSSHAIRLLQALYTVVKNEHILFGVDSSSNHILAQLGLQGAVPAFDPLGRVATGFDFENTATSSVAGHGIHFEAENAAIGSGWYVLAVSGSGDGPPEAIGTPDAVAVPFYPWITAPVAAGVPPYEAIDNTIRDYIADNARTKQSAGDGRSP
jgi:hypothetical protein